MNRRKIYEYYQKALENHDEIFDGVTYAPAGETRPMSKHS